MTKSKRSGIFVAGAILLAVCTTSASPGIAAKNGCNAQAGKQIAQMCVACHSFDSGRNMTGPALRGVVGRSAASAKGFRYSRALMNLDINWTTANLDKFLSGPQKFAKGTTMAFGGLPDKQRRADLICYLKTLK
ncbi:c-type cytochrome [Erythrobacteraceae bacterium E2-1 Yellow Sea]|nr:c-type cytochrome [Erythrobacteraceae bacterium E2-1 Yellow Sea]